MLDHTRDLVQAFHPGGDARAAAAQARILELLERGTTAFHRTHYEPGHITASAIVLRSGRSATNPEVLLVFHRRLERWLQPGGHVDPDDVDVIAAARREVVEETGIATDAPTSLVGLDVHEIPARRDEPRHYHHDLVFRFDALTDDVSVSPESRSVRWCGVDHLAGLGPDAALLSAVGRALRG